MAGTMDRDSVSVLTRVVVGTLLVNFTAQQPQDGLAATLTMELLVHIMEDFALAKFKNGSQYETATILP